MIENVILTKQMSILSGRTNFDPYFFQIFPWNTAKINNILQCLKTLKICYLRHAEHHAKTAFSMWPKWKEKIVLTNLLSEACILKRLGTDRFAYWYTCILKCLHAAMLSYLHTSILTCFHTDMRTRLGQQ